RNGLRLSRHFLSGKESATRRLADDGVWNVAHICVPHSRRALRKLVAAVQRFVRHSGRGARRVPYALVARNGKQYLRADWSDHAHRIGSEERHSHRRIRQGRIRKGQTAARSTLEGARLRLRPILMTSFAFIFGMLPLWFASGSGAVARRILGSTVIGGMIAASGIEIFLIPVTFYVIERISSGRTEKITSSQGND